MSIVIIVYLVLIILRAVKSIRHNPIPFCRSKVQAEWWFTVHCRPSYECIPLINCFPCLRVAEAIKFPEHLQNKSNILNNATASLLSQQESTGRAALITRLAVLDVVVSRSQLRGNDQYRWASESEQKYPVQNTQVKGRQLDLAFFSSSHGIFCDFPYSRTSFSADSHAFHIHLAAGNTFRLLLSKLWERFYFFWPD